MARERLHSSSPIGGNQCLNKSLIFTSKQQQEQMEAKFSAVYTQGLFLGTLSLELPGAMQVCHPQLLRCQHQTVA
ncbi:hypothetical protein OIU77_019949 [Salix suchowensis]|uniref:Uncharacterized protein n=1 Tax=Salix suchowensis TaxID=1278906 RepID=A0ABQ9CI01_9ROSI|nr:hypothetical protein OIU77_019949 [Salix suchowensis]